MLKRLTHVGGCNHQPVSSGGLHARPPSRVRPRRARLRAGHRHCGGAAQTGALDRALTTISGDGRPLSLSLQILVLMSLLTVLPSLVLMMTSFTRIIIVLSILRQALGLQQTPPNQVLVGLALFLSMFVMRPSLEQINASAFKPYGDGQIGIEEAVTRSATCSTAS
jgi:flagellar biosynthetic protein FliP